MKKQTHIFLFWLVVMPFLMALCGCSQTPSTSVIDAHINTIEQFKRQVVVVQKSIEPVCLTPAVQTQLNALESSADTLKQQAEAIKPVIKAEKQILQERIDYWILLAFFGWLTAGILALMAGYLFLPKLFGRLKFW